MAWPRHILDRIIDDVLEYIRPRATEKQQTLIRELENMLTVPTFEEQWPDEYQKARTKAKWRMKSIDDMRGGTSFEDTLMRSDVRKWWNEIY